MDLIVGNIYLQWIYFFLQICGYAGGVAFLSHVLYSSCKKKARCPSVTLNNFKTVNNMETVNNRRVSNQNRRGSNRKISRQVLDWSDVSDDDDEVEVIQLGGQMRRRNSGSVKSKVHPRHMDPEAPLMYGEEEPPPPYNIY